MPGRVYSGSNYRYGFNGKEKANETKGEGNGYDFGTRIYDPRTGTWLSTDPANKPWISPYEYAANNPVNVTDPDGKDDIHFHYYVVSVTMPFAVRTENGGVRYEPRTVQKTYTWVEIERNNNQDRFLFTARLQYHQGQ